MTTNKVPHLAAKLPKRAGKVEAFEIVRTARAGDPMTETQLATLYSYFLPPVVKKIKSVFEWVTLACDDKASYAFCKYVKVSDGCAVAANPKVAHIILGYGDKPGGWYDTQGGPVGDDVAIMPDVFKAIGESVSGTPVPNFTPSEIQVVDTPTGLAYVMPWNNRGVNKNYFDAMFCSLSNPVVTAGATGSFNVQGTVGGCAVTAVIMPFELPEYAEC